MSTPVPTPEQNTATTITPDQLNGIIAKVTAAVVPVATNAATTVVTNVAASANDTVNALHTESKSLIADVDQRAQAGIAANSQAIQDGLSSIVKSYAARLVSPRIQAALILGFAAIVGVGCLATWIAYLCGAPDAKGIVGWAFLALGGSSTGLGVLHQLGFLGTTNPTTATTVQSQVIGQQAQTTVTSQSPLTVNLPSAKAGT